MSSLDLDSRMNDLETEWRKAYESSIAARKDYQSQLESLKADARLLNRARDCMNRTEALKAEILAKIERLEESLLGSGAANAAASHES